MAYALLPHYGFRTGARGVHNTRTVMLDDLASLFSVVPSDAPRATYVQTVVEENALGKRTASTRTHAYRRLSELYALDPAVPVFRLLRHYWEADDGPGRPLLGMLCALARDPILRMTASPVLDLAYGAPFDKRSLEREVEARAPGRFSPTSVAKIARMTASSWTQAGHLEGRTEKRRSRPEATPAATAYALALGVLAGERGGALFETEWSRVIDRPLDGLHDLAQEASRRGLLIYRNAGGIVEVSFPGVLTENETMLEHEQG